MKLSKHFVPLLGYLFIFVLVSYPTLMAYSEIREGQVWTPFNDANQKVGDFYYYWPLSVEIIEGNSLIESAAILHDEGKYGIQIFNTTAAWLAAFPALFTSDLRWVYFFSLFGLFSMYFVFSYYFSLLFTKSILVSTLVALFFTWYYDFIKYIVPRLEFSAYTWPFRRFFAFQDYTFLSDNLRFNNTNATNLIFMTFFISLVALKKYPSFLKVGLCSLLGMILAYNYPPQYFVGVQIVSLAIALLFLTKKKMQSFRFLVLLGILLVFSLVTNYLGLYVQAQDVSPFVGIIFKKSVNFSFDALMATATSNTLYQKVLVFGGLGTVFMWLVSRGDKELHFWVSVVAVCFLFNTFVTGFSSNNHIIGRLFFRSLLVCWSLLFAVSLFTWVQRWTPQFVFKPLAVLALVFMAYFPVAGIFKFHYRISEQNYESQSIDANRWEVLQWIKANTEKNDVVLAANWSDVYMLPMMSFANLYYGHWILNNRPLSVEVRKYLSAMKFLGTSEVEVRTLLENSCESTDRWRRALVARWPNRQVPVVERSVFEEAMVAGAVFYWPYINSFDEVTICQEGPVSDSMWVEKLMAIYNNVDIISEFKDSKLDWLIIPKNVAEKLKLDPQTFESHFSNEYANIYRFRKTY